MSKFKIVFLDGKEIEIEALNFSAVYISAAYSRMQSGETSMRQLFMNEKACSIVVSKRRRKVREGK
jgi:hypothetical protein